MISLAGGLPDTSTFPPQSFAAQMTRIAQESAAEALQYGPTEGFEETKDCILEVMGAEGMLPDPEDVIVTTGGQQAIDLVTKTLVDPGDVGDLRGADLPRRGPGLLQLPGRRRSRSSATRTGCGSTSSKQLLDRARRRRAAAEVHLLGAELPEPGRGDDVAASAAGAWSSWPASARCWWSRTTPTACCATSGEPLPPLYQLDGGDYVIYIGTFSKILSPGIRLGWAVAPPPVMEKIVLGKQAADLCTSTLTQYFVREYFAEGRWRDYVDEPGRDLPRPPRRDARGAARALPAAGDLDRARGRALHLGDAARLHRHQRPAGQGAARERRLRPRPGRLRRRPRRAARCGSTSPASARTRSARGSGGSAR